MSGEKLNDIDKDTLEEACEYIYNLTGGDKRGFSKVKEDLEKQKKRNQQLRLAELEDLKSQGLKTASTVNEHVNSNQEMVDRLTKQTCHFEELERMKSYIGWIEIIETISCCIANHLMEGLVGSACDEYSRLLKVAETLSTTTCQNLKQFLQDTKTYWFEILTEKLTSEFDNVMKALKWPFTSGVTAPSVSNQPELHSRMEKIFCLLLKLQAPSSCYENQNGFLLPLDLLLKPLRKRFRFHFYGSKQTNSLEKPEWYFTQVLNWLKDHSDFLEHTVQPILDTNGFNQVDAKTEFTKGLLAVIEEKMRHCLPSLVKDDDLFSHFVDETLLFEKEFRLVAEYPSSQPGCLQVLTEEPCCLEKWLDVEKTCAMDHVESLLSAAGAWSLKYQEVADVDETKVPECAESFVTILQVMTDRYKGLSNLSHCLEFLNIQLQLLDHFVSSLKSSAQENSVHPTLHLYCSVMNASNYVQIMLQEWSEQTFFLQLSYHKFKTLVTSNVNGEGTGDDGLGHNTEDQVEEESVFTSALKSLEKLQEKMIEVLVDHIVECFRLRSKSYQKDRWHCLPTKKEYLVVSLSSSACEMMLYLKEKLTALEHQLAKCLFTATWKQLAAKLNSVVYKEVILVNHFNDGGALQLEYDMVKNLFLLFGEYTQKPENFFKEVKESCKLLSLLPGSAVLLRDLLNKSKSHDDEDEPNIPSPRAALSDIGVHKLTPQEAHTILGLRLNWPNS